MPKPRLVEVLTVRVTRRRWVEIPSERPPAAVVETTGELVPESRPGLARAEPRCQVVPLFRKAAG